MPSCTQSRNTWNISCFFIPTWLLLLFCNPNLFLYKSIYVCIYLSIFYQTISIVALIFFPFLRNPFDSIWSEYQRRESKSHVGGTYVYHVTMEMNEFTHTDLMEVSYRSHFSPFKLQIELCLPFVLNLISEKNLNFTYALIDVYYRNVRNS